jgi:CTP:phosphocholine cytidylyltransferase-like protein
MNKYTKNLPKGMLSIFGKSIIENQIDCYRRHGINDITVITGYKREKINI